MDVKLEPGTYVVAVSGGVDSMVLLDMVRRHPGIRLIVAHFDHGIRSDSDLDRQLVQEVTRRHGLQFVYDKGQLGSDVSEDVARKARYKFLRRARDASGARAIITAHHQDDLLETAVHNLLRGTGRRGLVSLRSRDRLVRPLLHVSKQDLVAYAKDQGLVWREDATNTDLRYRRNYIRHKIMSKFSQSQKQELLQHIRNIYNLDKELSRELTNHLHLHPGVSELDRHWFIMLPHSVAKEVLATWLRRHEVKELNSKMLDRLVMAAKTYSPGSKADVDKQHVLEVRKGLLALSSRER
jgi:tRNA(Ile)-lysidine synthase